MTWVPATFCIDDDLVAEGEHDPEVDWNGFACPRFTREAAERIAVMSITPPSNGIPPDYERWEWDGDTLRLHPNPEVIEPAVETWGPDGDGMYHIGAYAWTWYVKED